MGRLVFNFLLKGNLRFKLPSVYTLLFLLIAIAAAASWFVPGCQPQGIGAVLFAPVRGFHKSADIIAFLLVLGGFLGLVNATGALETGITRLLIRLQGRELLLIPVLMTLFALGGTIYGLGEETIAFWSLIIPVMERAGYDKMVAAGIIMVGANVGTMASTLNPFSTGIASFYAGIPVGEGIGLRLLMFVVLLGAACGFVMRYACKTRQNPVTTQMCKSDFGDLTVKSPALSRHQKLTLSAFAATFLVMIYGVMPWEEMGVRTLPAQNWWFNELACVFLVGAVVVAVLNGFSEKEIIHHFLSGARDMVSVVLVIAFARGIDVVLTDGAVIAALLPVIESWLYGLGVSVFAGLVFVIHLPLSALISSSAGLAVISIPWMVPLADTAGVSRDLVVTAYQAAGALMNMCAPTAPSLMAGLMLAGISFRRYLIWVMPLLVALCAVVITLLVFAA
ncbi:YfcC family protein [Spongorhabdus nitratireducens]